MVFRAAPTFIFYQERRKMHCWEMYKFQERVSTSTDLSPGSDTLVRGLSIPETHFLAIICKTSLIIYQEALNLPRVLI